MTKRSLTDAELSELYRDETMSIHKISRMYGMDRRTVRRWLVRAGISPRTHNEVVYLARKHKPIEPSTLRDLYWNSNLSLDRIGLQFGASGTWVRDQMIAAGIPLKAPWREKYAKTPFSGNPEEEAYLRGLRTGDLSCVIMGSQVRIATSTTHPEMFALLDKCFSRYGRVNGTPSRNKDSFEWSVYSYLHRSFNFLLDKCTVIPDVYERHPRLFFSFLSGYIDAEGAFRLYRDGESVAVSLRLRTEDRILLMEFRNYLRKLGYHTYLALELEHGQYKGKNYTKDVWVLGMFRKEEVANLFR